MNTHNRTNYQKGSAMLVAVIFFLAIMFIIVGGTAGPSLREIKVAHNLVNSKQSLYLAESGSEDVLYRLRNGVPVSSSETLSISGNTTQTTITDTSSGKEVNSHANYLNYNRKNTVTLITGVGVAFNYGIQTGNGGFEISNGASVTGNVYSNGDIVGANTAFITGTAIAANSISLDTDQVNDTPIAPPNNITFGNAATTQDFAQSFTAGTTTSVNKVELYIKKVGTPANETVRIMTDNAGSPGSTQLTTGTMSAAAVGTTYAWVTVTFTSTPTINEGMTYWIVIDGASSATKYYIIGGNSAYSSGVGKTGTLGGTWSAASDGYFRLYVGGRTSQIKDLSVGTVTGDARAHTVTNVTVSGKLYCQVGSSNNKSCDTSLADPAPIAFPIGDSIIQKFKDEAAAGSVINGSYSPVSNVTLGPAKINGDLNLDNGVVLTMTGTLWVTGKVTVSNNGRIKLDTGYGPNSGTVISNSYVNVNNGGNFVGSGTSGSYVLVLSESACPYDVSCSGNAVELANNAGAVIVNAQKGAVHLSNNAAAKEITADKVILDNNANVIYDSGISNAEFTSGPSGGWNIQTWQEVQ